TLFHREIDFLTVFIDFTGAKSDHFPLLRFFLGGIGDDDPAFFYFLLLDRLHQHPVSERFYVNCCHRLFTPSGFLFGLSRRLSISRQSPANYFGYFFFSSSSTSSSSSELRPSLFRQLLPTRGRGW